MGVSTAITGVGGPSFVTLMAVKHFAVVPNDQLIRHVYKEVELLNRLPETSIFDSLDDVVDKIKKWKRFLSDAGDTVAALERKWHDIDHCVNGVELVARDVKADLQSLRKRVDWVKKVLTWELTRDELLEVTGEIMDIFGDFGDVKEQLDQAKTQYKSCSAQILDFNLKCKEESARAKKWRLAGAVGTAAGIGAAAVPFALPVAAATATALKATGVIVGAGGAFVFFDYRGLVRCVDGILVSVQADIKKLKPLREKLHNLQRQHQKQMKEVKKIKKAVEQVVEQVVKQVV